MLIRDELMGSVLPSGSLASNLGHIAWVCKVFLSTSWHVRVYLVDTCDLQQSLSASNDKAPGRGRALCLHGYRTLLIGFPTSLDPWS